MVGWCGGELVMTCTALVVAATRTDHSSDRCCLEHASHKGLKHDFTPPLKTNREAGSSGKLGIV
ncbi:hypothetical protein QOZ95_000274 [Paenibacillus brasilensis]|uniref:Secreted protein n=1 Tax=Paenibacillus brasilensis TaxID=128574 RepID=A0ABU0KRR3_9BACL|nr:hypothetical protein [Paenibacillus brasilensis]